MRHLGLFTLSAALLCFGLTLGAAPHPAGAGKVCKKLGFGNRCVKSSDLNQNINGIAKAWARIKADGTIVSCWRCNTDPLETRKIGTGAYEIDFTPLATDIRGRPRVATIDTHDTFGPGRSYLVLVNRVFDDSSVWVGTFEDVFGNQEDKAFTLVVY